MAQLQSTGITGSFVVPGTGGFFKNTMIGFRAGNSVSTGTSNVFIGSAAGNNVTTQTNVVCLGSGSRATTAASNEVILGNGSTSVLRCSATGISSLSDFRDKTEISDLNLGLSFIEKLRPVTFKWDKREWYADRKPDGSLKGESIQTGFLAQDLYQLQNEFSASYLKISTFNEEADFYDATPSYLLTPVIKAIQEQSVEIKALKTELNSVKNILSSSLNL